MRDVRFARSLPLVVYHGDSWVPVLKRLLDSSLYVSDLEDHMDTALQSACYLRRTETLQTLLDWCRDSPLRQRTFFGLGHGLVSVVRSANLEVTQQILDSKLKLPAELFSQAYIYASNHNSTDFEIQCQQVLLEWGVERSSRDVAFANELQFVPKGNSAPDDQLMLQIHLRETRSSKPHKTSLRHLTHPRCEMSQRIGDPLLDLIVPTSAGMF